MCSVGGRKGASVWARKILDGLFGALCVLSRLEVFSGVLVGRVTDAAVAPSQS